MKVINKKLNNNKGASILLALMLFFVCFMVASVILSSATANADKIREREDIQKEYLSVSSAANLLRDIIGGTEYTGWEINKVFFYQNYAERNRGIQEDLPDKSLNMEYQREEWEKIKSALERMVYRTFSSHTVYCDTEPVDDFLTSEFVISGNNMEGVQVKMIVDTKTYNIRCEFTRVGGREKSNALTVEFKASSMKDDPPKSREYRDRNYTYEVEVADSDGDGTHWEEREYIIKEERIDTNITYDAGTIKKGVSP